MQRVLGIHYAQFSAIVIYSCNFFYRQVSGPDWLLDGILLSPRWKPLEGRNTARAIGQDSTESSRSRCKDGYLNDSYACPREARGIANLGLRNIPLKAIDKFDFTLNQPMTAPNALGCTSIFDACSSVGKP